jgi:periplasmic protein CpxP/Spy
MNTLKINRWLVIAIVLLLLINLATVALLWTGRDKKQGGPPGGEAAAEFIIRETQMDKAQQEQYRALVQTHRRNAEALRRDMGQYKEQFFDLLQEKNISDSVLRTAALKANSTSQELDILTFRHFEEVRKLLRPEQQSAFDDIIKEALRMMGRPGHPPGPPPPNR